MERTVTTTGGMHEYEIGDRVFLQLHTPDRRWWKRLWHFVTFRAPPVITENLSATVTSSTTLTVPNARLSGRGKQDGTE